MTTAKSEFWRRAATAGAAIAVAATLAACSSSGGSSAGSQPAPTGQTPVGTGGPTSSTSSLHDMLPSSVRQSGVIRVGLNAEYPPYEFVNTQTQQIEGIDPDLMAAVGKVLGVKFQISNIPFSSVIPSLQAGRFDVIWSDAGDTADRQKVVDILDYDKTNQNFLWKKGGFEVTSLTALCGHRVAVDQGSLSVGFVKTLSTKCTSAGKPAIAVQTYPNQNAAVLAVQNGRADATSNASEINAYTVSKSNGTLVSGGPSYEDEIDGILFPKGSPLLKPIQSALEQLRDDGTYKQIFTKWGIPQNTLPEFTVNGTS